ncbi:MAG: hypothetical protein M3308_11370 [Actinomycetota bacterium]|nr:hypothetical protein [Actinomycetota bacterium]
MVWHFLLCEDELGLRVGEGLGLTPDDVRHLEPAPSYDGPTTTASGGAVVVRGPVCGAEPEEVRTIYG